MSPDFSAIPVSGHSCTGCPSLVWDSLTWVTWYHQARALGTLQPGAACQLVNIVWCKGLGACWLREGLPRQEKPREALRGMPSLAIHSTLPSCTHCGRSRALPHQWHLIGVDIPGSMLQWKTALPHAVLWT